VLFRTKTGELSVRAERVRLLVKSLRPLPDKWHGLADTETRYRQRYVDLIVNERSREVFRARSKIVSYLRDFLDALDFLEVETPMMQVIPGGAAAKPFVTHHNALGVDMYLRIAPELYLKRLVVGGFERVYEINRNFRNEGLSTRHNPEFTMLELYRLTDYRDLMDMVERIFRHRGHGGRHRPSVPGHHSTSARRSGGSRSRPRRPFQRASNAEGCAISGTCGRLRAVGIEAEAADARKLQIAIFEKTAGAEQPTFVYAYPAEVSPLARRNDSDPFITDRFEFFVGGRELANGFSELNDPDDQAARFREQVERKRAGDEEAMFYDADYVRALEYGLPPTAGLGIGVDRMVMLFTNQASIRDVLLFPHMRPE
jgi:lysyl-tRNA synthetase class 2